MVENQHKSRIEIATLKKYSLVSNYAEITLGTEKAKESL